jgi:hypothetical protein
MRTRSTILKGLVAVISGALHAADRDDVAVYEVAAPEDIWAIPSRPAIACGVFRRTARGPIPMGGGNSGQEVSATVGIAYVWDDPEGPTGALTDASFGVEALAALVEPTLRAEDLSDKIDMEGPIRLIFTEESTERAPFDRADQRAGGALALVQTFETTDFYD